jgi:hypothetical protein
MRFHLRTPKAAWSFLSFPAVLLAAGVTGCDSAPSANDPVIKQSAQAQQEVIKKGDEEANAQLKKNMGKGAPMLKSIKSGLKGGQAPEQ